MIDSRFKSINCSSDLMQMVVGHMDAEAYVFRAFDKWEDALTKSFGKKYISDTWVDLSLTIDTAYLLLIDEYDAWVVDIFFAQRAINAGILETLTNMLDKD